MCLLVLDFEYGLSWSVYSFNKTKHDHSNNNNKYDYEQ